MYVTGDNYGIFKCLRVLIVYLSLKVEREAMEKTFDNGISV